MQPTVPGESYIPTVAPTSIPTSGDAPSAAAKRVRPPRGKGLARGDANLATTKYIDRSRTVRAFHGSCGSGPSQSNRASPGKSLETEVRPAAHGHTCTTVGELMVSNGPSRLDEHCMCNELSTVLRSVYPEHNMARGHASSLLVDSLLRIICCNGRPTAGNELMRSPPAGRTARAAGQRGCGG